MPAVHLVDETFVVADPEQVRAVACDPARWARWFPGIRLTAYDDRAALGVRWTVAGPLTGTAEVWLEEHGDGVIVHAYLRVDPSSAPARRRRALRGVEADYASRLKAGMFEVKRLLEGDRAPGSPRVPLSQRVVSASDNGQGTPRPGSSRPPAR